MRKIEKAVRHYGTKALREKTVNNHSTKPSRGTNEVRDELASTEVLNFRCKSEWCCLTRGAVNAFTLAEVLITLAIIGVVAVLTIPSLIQDINNRQYITATNNFNRKFGEALKIMNNKGVLSGYKTTQDFLNELGKVFKVVKICDNEKLNQCFSPKITWQDKLVDTVTLKKSFNIVDDDWGTDVLGVQFTNGVSGLIAYNPKCEQDQFNNDLIQINGDKNSVVFGTNNCIAMLYDVNSNKNPNKVGTDISRTLNVENLGDIIATINGVKITKIIKNGEFESIFYGQNGELNCDEFKSKYNISSCCVDDDKLSTCATNGDYWAGAVKACGGPQNMPTQEELIEIAKYLYDDDSIPLKTDSTSGLKQNTTKIAELSSYGFPASGVFSIWSSSAGILNAYRPTYNLMYAGFPYRANAQGIAVCVKH